MDTRRFNGWRFKTLQGGGPTFRWGKGRKFYSPGVPKDFPPGEKIEWNISESFWFTPSRAGVSPWGETAFDPWIVS